MSTHNCVALVQQASHVSQPPAVGITYSVCLFGFYFIVQILKQIAKERPVVSNSSFSTFNLNTNMKLINSADVDCHHIMTDISKMQVFSTRIKTCHAMLMSAATTRQVVLLYEACCQTGNYQFMNSS